MASVILFFQRYFDNLEIILTSSSFSQICDMPSVFLDFQALYLSVLVGP